MTFRRLGGEAGGGADGETVTLAHIDECLDAGGENGLGTIDAAVADPEHLPRRGIGNRPNWGGIARAPLGHVRQPRRDHAPLRLAEVAAVHVQITPWGLGPWRRRTRRPNPTGLHIGPTSVGGST